MKKEIIFLNKWKWLEKYKYILTLKLRSAFKVDFTTNLKIVKIKCNLFEKKNREHGGGLN